ncbi:MAG TPA: DUF4157 domain-containing protein [Leptolyngbyaceae cyanobacterium]
MSETRSAQAKNAAAPTSSQVSSLQPRPFTEADEAATVAGTPSHQFEQIAIQPPPTQTKLAGGDSSEQATEQHEGSTNQGNQSKTGNLPDTIQAKMENAFNADFSDVNVYENSASAKDLNAIAYTQGNEIHFAPGHSPYSSQGQEYLGHELSHVVQQRSGIVQTTHTENGYAVNDDASLEAQADEEGRRAAKGEAVRSETTAGNQPVSSASVQKKSQPIQMWRDVPGGIRFGLKEPDTAKAWQVFMQAARQSAGNRYANWAEPELRTVYESLISDRLRGDLSSISIDTHTTDGYNLHWKGSIRFLFGDVDTALPGGGNATTTLNDSSSSSSSVQSSSSITNGTTGSGQGGHTPGDSGGRGGQGSVGGSGSTTTGTQITQGNTFSSGGSSQINQHLDYYSTELGIAVNITASYDMGSSWTDWVNPAVYGTWGGMNLMQENGSATGPCGKIRYYRGDGITTPGTATVSGGGI